LLPIIKEGYELVITHGNGPQIGFLLLRSHFSRNLLPEIPLEGGNAMTQGEIGYMISETLTNILREKNIEKEAVAVLTRVLVSPFDPSFKRPTKPIGPFYSRAEAAELQKKYQWVMKEDAGRGFRRIVPSPKPLDILEKEAIKDLLDKGSVVIACGGGGIPVVREDGVPTERKAITYRGVASVVDKDLASSLLATLIQASLFIISTAVDRVYLNYGQANQRPLFVLTTKEAKRYLKEGQFPEGSMGPKIKSAIRFLESGGEEVIITSPEKIGMALKGKAGTRVIR